MSFLALNEKAYSPDFNYAFNTFQGNGVFTNNSLVIAAQSVPDLTVQLTTPGVIYANGRLRAVVGAYSALPVTAADATNDRFDAVVVRKHSTESTLSPRSNTSATLHHYFQKLFTFTTPGTMNTDTGGVLGLSMALSKSSSPSGRVFFQLRPDASPNTVVMSGNATASQVTTVKGVVDVGLGLTEAFAAPFTTENGNLVVGNNASGFEKHAQQISFGSATVLSSVSVYVATTFSNVVSALTCRIETDAAGSPSGTLVSVGATAATSDFAYGTSGGGETQNYWVTFFFSAGVSLSGATNYHIVITTATEAEGGSQNYRVGSTTNGGATGKLENFASGTWSDDTGNDLSVRYTTTPGSGITPNLSASTAYSVWVRKETQTETYTHYYQTSVTATACEVFYGRVKVIAGTPAAVPQRPALVSDAILLADLSIPALATTIDSTGIFDKRTFIPTDWHYTLDLTGLGLSNGTSNVAESGTHGWFGMASAGGTTSSTISVEADWFTVLDSTASSGASNVSVMMPFRSILNVTVTAVGGSTHTRIAYWVSP